MALLKSVTFLCDIKFQRNAGFLYLRYRITETNSLYGRREIAYANFSSPLRNKVAQEMRRNMKLEEMRVIILRKGYIKAK